MVSRLRMRQSTTLPLRASLLTAAMVFTTFTEGKRVIQQAVTTVSNAVIDYFKAGNTITDEQLNGMRVADVKKK